MSNPIFSSFGKQFQNNNNSNSLFGMINQIKNSPDPNAAAQMMLASNPQYQNVFRYIEQNGGDAKSAFYNLAAQMGVDPNSILNQLK